MIALLLDHAGPIAVIIGTPCSIFSGICVTQWLFWYGCGGI